jgi:phosphonopyruvate decarboxylase
MIVTWRGQPGLKDEPQHVLMGEITAALLDTIRIEHAMFPTEDGAVMAALGGALSTMEKASLPYAFIMEKGAVHDDGLEQVEPLPPMAGNHNDLCAGGTRPRRIDILAKFLEIVPPDAAVIAPTGKCGRELFTLDDRPQHIYQVGSMGCAGAMGLGVALNAERPVVVLDGDGAALMHLGNLASIGARAPKNLIHVVLDNGVHDSTGGQQTVSTSVDFAKIAVACGYRQAASCDDPAGFERAFKDAANAVGPALIHIRIAPGSIENLGRPTIGPPEVAARFKEFLASG